MAFGFGGKDHIIKPIEILRRYSYEKGIGIIFGINLYVVSSCDKATGSGEPVRDGDVSDISEIDKNVSSETEQTQQANVESISGTISHIDEDKICDLTEEEVKIIADIIGNGTWNTEGTADCANDCKLIIDERTYYYHSECGTFNDEKNNQNLPVTAEEKENINAILAQYITLGLE